MTISENKQLIFDFLKNLNIENLCVTDYISLDDLDETTTVNDITNLIDDNNGFDVEIVYYSNAIKYLMENDPSLHESLGLATEYGYEAKDLSSEILASMLASQECRNDWSNCENEIESFLLDLEWDEESEEK